MINRIDIFMPPLSRYGVLHHMTRDIYEAMKRAGVNCKLLVAQYDNPQPFLESIFSDPPECTLSLNGLLPDSNGKFFCDLIKIPHVACLVDSPNQFIPLTQSSRNVITCPDVYATHFFKGLNFENSVFLPHGVGKEISPDPDAEKKYDVVLLASCIDYDAIKNSWKDKYPKKLCNALEEAAEITLSDQTTPYVEAFVTALNHNIPKSESLDPNKFHLMQILDDLEMYIRGKDRVELVRSIKDAKVDIIGAGKNGSGWNKYITDEYPNITLHDPIPFEEALSVMKQSKIILNSCPWIKNGGHERIFAGMACGALVVTSENSYMADHFVNGEDIAYYYYGRWDEVNDLISDYLKDDAKRQKMIKQSQQKVKDGHTWDHRVKSLLEALPKLLDHVKANNPN